MKTWPIKIGGQERAVSLHNGYFYRHGGGVELNLSSSRKYALEPEQFLSEVGAFHWPPKTTILWVLALYSIGCNVRLYASVKLKVGGPRS